MRASTTPQYELYARIRRYVALLAMVRAYGSAVSAYDHRVQIIEEDLCINL